MSFISDTSSSTPTGARGGGAAHATRPQAQLGRGNSMAKYVSSSRVASKKIKVWLMTSPYDLKPPLSPRWHACGARRLVVAAAWRAPLIILKINCLIVLPAVFDKVSINMLKILLTTTAQWSILKKSYLENNKFQAPWMKMKLRRFGDLDACKIVFIFEKEWHMYMQIK
jgi:hypothetical protein